jgi:hypothetical protein
LLGGIGVGTVSVSVSHVNYNTSNAQACYGYWQLNDARYADQEPAAARGWRSLEVAAPKITDPTLSVSVQAFDEEMESALPDTQTSSIALQSACNALGYSNPAP